MTLRPWILKANCVCLFSAIFCDSKPTSSLVEIFLSKCRSGLVVAVSLCLDTHFTIVKLVKCVSLLSFTCHICFWMLTRIFTWKEYERLTLCVVYDHVKAVSWKWYKAGWPCIHCYRSWSQQSLLKKSTYDVRMTLNYQKEVCNFPAAYVFHFVSGSVCVLRPF